MSLRDRVRTVDGEAGGLPGLSGDVFLRLAGETIAPPPPPLLVDDPRVCRPNYAVGHLTFTGPTVDVGVFRLGEALYDGYGLVRSGVGEILAGRETTAAYWANALTRGTAGAVPSRLPVRDIKGPAIASMTPGLRSYGHWLLEILPRLWLARLALGEAAFARHAVLVDETMPAWAPDLMRQAAGVEPPQIVRYHHGAALLRVPELVVPGLMHGDFRFHPFAARFFDGLPDSGRTDLPRAFYIKRSPPERGAKGILRTSVNADDIESRLASEGIPGIWLEDLSWPDQIALFRRAELIVGEFGSGLHNAIFSPASTRVVCLGILAEVQSTIAAFRGQRIAYVQPSTETEADSVRQFRFKMGAIKLALNAALNS